MDHEEREIERGREEERERGRGRGQARERDRELSKQNSKDGWDEMNQKKEKKVTKSRRKGYFCIKDRPSFR